MVGSLEYFLLFVVYFIIIIKCGLNRICAIIIGRTMRVMLASRHIIKYCVSNYLTRFYYFLL